MGGAGYLVRQSLFLGALSEIAELQLAMFDLKAGAVPEYAPKITSLAIPKKAAGGRLKRIWDDAIDPMPRMLRGYDLTDVHRQVAALEPGKFDAVFAFRIDFAHFAGVLNHPRLILDIDDPEHIRGYRRLQALGGGDRRTLADLEKLKMFERRAVAGAKLAFVCQENDQAGWDRSPEVVPNCVRVIANPTRKVSRPIVLFVGNCAGGITSPNVDAVRYFLSDIWPKVLAKIPEAEFHIVGAASEAVKQPAAAAPRVVLRGFVDDLAEVYAESSLSVAPIRFGTGTRVKILEAFAHGCPVVSTLAGAEGIDAVPGREIELAAGAEDFANWTAALLQDRELNGRIGSGGHALALREYDSVVQRQKLVERLREALIALAPALRNASEPASFEMRTV
jgi:glycosyltransferase involved in cell wall biosynthesis